MVTGVDMAARWRVRKATCHHPQSLRTAIRAGRVVGTDVVQLRGGGTRGRGQTRPAEKGSAMPLHTVLTTMLGSLLGTVAQSMCVYEVGPLTAGPSPDRAALGGSPCALGLLLHLRSGSVVFPVGFLALPADAVPGPPVLRGMLWAGCLWLALETSSPCCSALASSVRRWAASWPRCERCWGTWSMAPHSAALLGHQHPRTGGPRVACKPAQGKADPGGFPRRSFPARQWPSRQVETALGRGGFSAVVGLWACWWAIGRACGPYGDLRMTRGRCGSLALHWRRLPLPGPCQSPSTSGPRVSAVCDDASVIRPARAGAPWLPGGPPCQTPR